MIQVDTPDGGIAEFPDETPPDVMRNALRKKFPPAQSVAADIASKAGGYAKQFGLGAIEGLETAVPIAAGAMTGGPGAIEAVNRIVQGVNARSGAFTEPSGTGQEFARTTGQFVGNPASYVGGSSVGMKVLQAISSAVGSEGLRQLVKGQGPVAEGVASIAGAVLGGQVPRLGTAPRVLKPKQAAHVQTLREFGVEPTAGDVIGSGAIRRTEQTLGNAPGAGGAATKADTRIGQQLTDAVVREMGEKSSVADTNISDILSNARERLQNSFENTAKKLPINHDAKIGNDLVGISSDLLEEGLPDDTIRLLQKQIDNIQNGFVTGRGVGGQMSGKTYQNLTKKNSPLDRATNSNDPNVSYYATRIRTALDDAMERSATGRGTREGTGRRAALAELRNTRRQWYTMVVLSNAVASSGEKAAHDIVTPARLRSIIAGTGDQKIQYALQRSNLARLAKSGEAVLSKLPNSNTAERSFITAIPSAIGSALGGAATGGWGAIPGALAGAALPGLTGRAIMSRPVQHLIKKNKPGNAPVALRSAAVAAINQLGGKQAPDGNYYIPDPKRPGKYLQVVPRAAQAAAP